MTREELARHDGREGRRAYVAVNGVIYDFTDSPLWPGGHHENLHRAGCDLTAELLKAPHVRAVVERYPVVGELKEALPVRKQAPMAVLVAVALVIAVLLYFLFR
jgi:predicted heme/steroid binding protein